MIGRRNENSAGNAMRYQRGLAAYETGQYPRAIEALAQIAERRHLPGTLARFYLGQAHLQQGIVDLDAGRHAEAARHFSEARRINPAAPGLSEYLTRCHLGQRQYELAAAEMERDGASSAATTDAIIRRAHALARSGQHASAVELLTKEADRSPHRVALRFQLGVMHASVDAYLPAADAFETVIRRAPLHLDARHHLGLALAALGRVNDAMRHLSIVSKLRPHDAGLEAILRLAPASDRIAEGIATITTSTDAPAAIGPAADAQAADASAAVTTAIDLLGRLVAEEPDFVEAFLNLPDSAVDAEIFSMLSAVLESALERHPDFADLHYHCSRVRARLGKTQAAIASAAEAVRINPRYVQAMIQLGRLYAVSDAGDSAIDRLNDAIRAGGDYPDVHFLLGELYRERGRNDDARRAYRRALDLNANYESARRALETVAAA
jgi:tetratricopeptide (TPR) repeat protein